MGAHFYSNDPVGSVTLVTNSVGMPLTRYVYKPYGELNMELTNTNLDGDDNYYESIFKYNGQEFDYELGIYNYNARNYDQMTGRFMQTDPVFSERRGFDSYDPYSYVASNPVNFTDPTGASWVSTAANKAKEDVKTLVARNIKVLRYAAIAAAVWLAPTNLLLYTGAVLATGALGAVIGGAAVGLGGYLYGGLKDSRMNKLDWNDQRAREYGEQGMLIGATAGFAAGIATAIALTLAAGLGYGAALYFTAAGELIWSSVASTFVGSEFIFGSSGLVDDYLIIGGKTRLKLPFKERNMAHHGGFVGKFLSEFDYNGDGRVDNLEYGIAWTSGARRSQLDTDYNGRVDFWEGATYGAIAGLGGRNNWDMFLMLYHVNRK